VRGEAAREILGAEPVDGERKVRAVLLDGAERKQDDDARVARERARLDPRQVGQPDEAVSAQGRSPFPASASCPSR
jgi:hypothetical protein